MKYQLLLALLLAYVETFSQESKTLELVAYSSCLSKHNGISGMDYSDGTLYFVSDYESGVYKISLSLDLKGNVIKCKEQKTLKIAPSQKGLESIRLIDKAVWFAAEPDEKDGIQNTYLLKGTFANSGIKITDTVKSLHKKNLQGNSGIEGLTFSGDKVWYAIERPIIGEEINHKVQFFRIDRKVNNPTDAASFTYYLQSMDSFGNDTSAFYDNGVSEILALSEDHMILLERAYSRNTKRTYVKLFEGKVSENRTISKTLIYDLNANLDSLKVKINREVGIIDNYEAMCFGPDLGGYKTILLASDNNRNSNNKQHTDLLVFKTNILSSESTK